MANEKSKELVSKFEEPKANLFGNSKDIKMQKTYTVTPTGVML